MRKHVQLAIVASAFAVCTTCLAQSDSSNQPRVIELRANKDSRYLQGKKVSPEIEVFAGEPLVLRITAERAKEIARDGSVHGLALLDQNLDAVPGWRFFLHPGVQDLAVVSPARPGRYTAVCTVICSDGHEGMGFTLLVTNRTNKQEQGR